MKVTANSLKILILCPHFAPDTAPTGVIMDRIVHELSELGHEIHVVTSLPWYRRHQVDIGWENTSWRRRTQVMDWGSVVRLNPFAGSDKRNLWRRALGFAGFSVLAVAAGIRAGRGQRVDVIVAMSPPLTLGLGARLVGICRRAPVIFNIQDVFPDAAIETGAMTNPFVIAIARLLEKVSYRLSRLITVLSDDLQANVLAKIPARDADKVVVIPNFVDTEMIQPLDRHTAYRSELGIDEQQIVMYAGNVGFSQSLHLLLDAARELPDVAFVINGDGSARQSLEIDAMGLQNVYFADFQPAERLAEVLATADVHVVALRQGLGKVSVPSKTYSIMAAGRPIVAAIDPGTQVPRLIEQADCGVVVPPDDSASFVVALQTVLGDTQRMTEMGHRARVFVESQASPQVVAHRYVDLMRGLQAR